MGSKLLTISPDFDVTLEYPDEVSSEVFSAMVVVVKVVSPSIVSDGVYIKGALLALPGPDLVRVGFFRQAGRFVREYTFPLPGLLQAVAPGMELLDPDSKAEDLPAATLDEMRRQMRIYRRW